LDTGVIANSTWYYFYVIRRTDTGVVDVVFSISSPGPNLPANYTQYRYIGAGLTNGSGQWTSFIQTGREFWWHVPILDFGALGSATPALLTLTLPRGRKVKAFMRANVVAAGGAQGICIYDPDRTDQAVSATTGALASIASSNSGAGYVGTEINSWTNSSGQVKHVELNNTFNVYINTIGWLDLADTQ
jgi:hypothetical protein